MWWNAFQNLQIGSKMMHFLAEKAQAKAEFRVDLSDIPLTHRRDRIEVIAGIANECAASSDPLSCASDRATRCSISVLCQQLISTRNKSIPIDSKTLDPSPPVAKGLFPASEKGLNENAPREGR